MNLRESNGYTYLDFHTHILFLNEKHYLLNSIVALLQFYLNNRSTNDLRRRSMIGCFPWAFNIDIVIGSLSFYRRDKDLPYTGKQCMTNITFLGSICRVLINTRI